VLLRLAPARYGHLKTYDHSRSRDGIDATISAYGSCDARDINLHPALATDEDHP